MKKFYFISFLKISFVSLVIWFLGHMMVNISTAQYKLRTDVELYDGTVSEKVMLNDGLDTKFIIAVKLNNGGVDGVRVTPEQYVEYNIGDEATVHSPKCLAVDGCSKNTVFQFLIVMLALSLILAVMGFIGFCISIWQEYNRLTNKRGFL